MNKLAVVISPNYKDYAKKYLADCLASLRTQTFKEFDLFLVDNESNDETLIYLKTLAPEATVIPLQKNEGFAGGNNAALKLIIDKGYDYCVLVNMDTVLAETCLANWLKAAQQAPAAAIQARLMLWPEKEKINSLGNVTHFLGFGFSNNYQEVYFNFSNNLIPIAYPSGAAVFLPVKILAEVGLFDEIMWMYNEDQDLGWRWWLSGRQCLLAPDAVVYHKYDFGRSSSKYYWLDRNRIIVILKNYHWLTLLLIFPAFILMEFGLILFSFKSGWFKEKFKVWRYFFSFKNWHYIMVERAKIQAQRKVRDRLVNKLFSGRIWYQEIDDAKLRLINPVFNLYWKMIRLIMFW